MRVSATLVVSVALFVSAGALTARQSGQAPPIFRAGANLVSVDAYPRNNGAIVEGLTAADFEVLEDGKAQTVDSVDLVRFPQPDPLLERRDPGSVGESWQLVADPTQRAFVLYFDTYHSTRLSAYNARTSISGFLEHTLGDHDLVAMTTPDAPPAALTFGRRLEAIREFLQSDWAGAETRRSPDESIIEQCAVTGIADSVAARRRAERAVGRWRLDRVFKNLQALVKKLAAVRDGRTNVVLISEGWADPGPMPDLTPAAHVGRCEQEFARLKDVDLNVEQKFVIDDARRARISFYPVNPVGLITFATSTGDITSASFRDMRPTENLRALAIETGGTAVVDTNNTRGGLQGIAGELSSYYLLGYYSTNKNFDGKYRKIAVRVRRPRVEVTARRGYVAPTMEMFRAAARPAPPASSASAVPLLGEPATFRITGTSRSTVTDLQFRRTDRIRIEWPRLVALDRRAARVLDRSGQPLPVSLTVSEPDSTPAILAIDLPLAPFSEGSYLIELTAGRGTDTQRSIVTINVSR